jgi:hypothetical protein
MTLTNGLRKGSVEGRAAPEVDLHTYGKDVM